MHYSSLLAASLVAPLVVAHGGIPGAPKVYGLPNHLRARNPFAGFEAPRHAGPIKSLAARQNQVNAAPGGTCGPSNGNAVCQQSECCSPEGNCGNGPDYCAAPDCLINYGPACDANQTPAGASTRNDARPALGNVAVGGAGIYSCVNAGEVALTFDDGPYIYTTDILDILDAAQVKATFFVTGNNLGKGAIDTNWAGVISRMDSSGHQVASHTWSHQDLEQVTQDQAYDQMVKNEMAIRNILGKYPTYMRPPYSSCMSQCQGVCSALGYHIIYFDLDTDDYDQDSPDKIQVAKDNFKTGIDNRGAANERLVIAHDIHEQTAHNLTAYMLSYLKSQNLTPVTVGQCLGDAKENWYRSSTPGTPIASTTASAPVSTPTGPLSPNGNCGPSNGGYSCVGFKQTNGLLGECCSQYGYCGSSAEYCGTGCNPVFGKCGVSSSSATVSAPAATATAMSNNGACGGMLGTTCAGYVSQNGVLSECCSSSGYCGNTTDYCGTGCQTGFGKCLGGSSSMSSMMSTASASASSASAMSSSASRSSSVAVSSGSVSGSATRSSSVASASSTKASVSSGSSSVKPTSAASSGSASVKPTAASSGSSSVKPTAASSGSASVKPTAASSGSPSVKPTSAPASVKPTSYPASVKPTSYPASVKPTSVYAASSFYTAVKPSSVGAYAANSPSPSAKVSNNGKCGTKYGGGQTCAGYKNSMGVAVECCCADSGTCSNDSWSCGQGCDKGYGKCWGY